MEQYGKSRSGPLPEKTSDLDAEIRHLKEQIKAQDAVIRDLQTDMRRLKSKLDRHAVHLNKISRG